MSLHSLLTRLIWLCVGPLVLLGSYLAIASVMSKQAERDLEAANLAKNIATAIDQHLNTRIGALHMLAGSPLVDDASRWKDLYREAQGFHQSFGCHVILADLEMHMLFNTSVPFGTKLPMLPRPKGHAAAPVAVETGKPAVGDIFFGKITKEPLVAIAVPAQREGKIAFLLLTIFETRQFQERLDRVALPSGWSLTLLDGNHEAIARRAPSGLNPVTDVDASGRFVVKSAVSPWSVVLEIPRDLYRKSMINAAAVLAIAILCATLAGILGGMLASRRLGRSIASLAETPAPGAPPPDITEIATVRRLLDESAEKRDTAEAALRESEQKYRALNDSLPVGVSIIGPNMEILAANSTKHKWFPESDYGQHPLCYAAYNLRPRTEPCEGCPVVKTFQDGQAHTAKREANTSRGMRSLFMTTVPLTDRDGKVISVHETVEDITERKAMEADITRQNIALQALNEVLSKTLISEAEEEVAQTCLEVAERLTKSEFGWIGEINQSGRMDTIAISNHGWSACRIPKAEAIARIKAMEIRGLWGRTLREGRSQVVNDPTSDPDHVGVPEGHPHVTSFLGVPLKRGNKVLGMISMGNKETGYGPDDQHAVEELSSALTLALDRIRAEQKVRAYSKHLENTVNERTEEVTKVLVEMKEGRDHLNSILLSVSDGLVVTNHEGRVTLMNPAAEELLGFKPEGVVGQPLQLAIQDKTLRDRMRNALEEKDPGYKFDFEVSGKDTDRPRVLRARTAKMLSESGDHEGMVIVISDVTLEREVDRMKTEFLSTAAHELRTPLTSILGFSEILLTRDNLSLEEKAKFLTYVHAQAMALRSIINDLLDICRIESGRGFLLNRTDVDMAGLVQGVTKTFEERLSRHRFDLVFPENALKVNADSEKMVQVLDNVLSNAVKYSPKGGVIRIVLEVEGGECRACVADEGIGMTPDQVDKVFEKFWRADASNKAMEGTGLGMSIVKYIVEAHGGKVWVESEYGKGTKVTFTVPVK